MEERLERVLPNNLDAEKSVLGSMLLEKDALELVLEQLKAEDFYSAAHQHIFEAMANIRAAGHAVDLVTLSEELERRGFLDMVVLKTWDKSLNQAEKRIYDISMRKTEDSLASIQDIVPDAINEIGELMARQGKLTGVATGFVDLDRMTNGLQKSDLIIVAARPAMGKSAFALNIAQYAALHDNRSVVYFSLEMGKEQLVMRMLCTEGAVDSQRIKEGLLTDDEMSRIMDVAEPMQRSKIHIDDSGNATVASIRSKCRRLKAKEGLDLVIVDYMQLMQGTGMGSRKNDSRQQEVSDMTRAMKLLARELDVPIILLAQLNRGPETRQDHKPMIADLRESGSIEQDADMVILLYRPQVYDETADNTSDIIIAKHRHGPTGEVHLAWQGEYTRFMNLARET